VKESTKQERHNKRLAQLLGIDPEAVQAMRSKERSDDIIREAQAVLLFIERPEAFISKKCDQCHAAFLTTYQFVSCCSTDCRIKSLANIGIDWNPLHSPEERWKRSKIPTEYSIPPRALQILLQMGAEQQQEEHLQVSEPPEQTSNTPPSYNDAPKSLPESPLVPESSGSEDLLKELGLDLLL